MATPSRSSSLTTTTTPKGTKKAHRGQQTTRVRRFTFSEPSVPAELAEVKHTYANIRPQTNPIPNQATTVQDRKCVKTQQEEREGRALRKGRSLPSMGRAAANNNKGQPSNSPPRQDSTPSSTCPTTTTTTTNSIKPPRHSKHAKLASPHKPPTTTTPTSISTYSSSSAIPTTPVARWAGGAFENSPPPSSLPIPDFDDITNSNTTTKDDDMINLLIPTSASSNPHPNQNSPPLADNQPRLRSPVSNHSTSSPPSFNIYHPHQQQYHPLSPLTYDPVVVPARHHSPTPAPPLSPTGRDLDQLSSDLRRMLGISVST